MLNSFGQVVRVVLDSAPDLVRIEVSLFCPCMQMAGIIDGTVEWYEGEYYVLTDNELLKLINRHDATGCTKRFINVGGSNGLPV